jgi:hypothetical protein
MGNRKIVLFLLSFLYFSAYSQDSVKWNWKVSSERKSESVYELTFTSPVPAGWQLYAPVQDISGTNSSALVFTDSSITEQKPLSPVSETKLMTSTIFDGQQFRVHENKADWTTTIRINGPVPGKLLGTLQYTYGKGDEFYPLESFPFEVALEGGITVNNRIRIETVNISGPVNNCGITRTEQKGSLWSFFSWGFSADW